MDYLTSINHDTFINIMLVWGVIGVVSALAIHFMQILPISNKADNSRLSYFGTINKRWAWIIMETPVLLVISYFYFSGSNPLGVSGFFVLAFLFHYTNRALIYPFRIKVKGKTMAVSMMLTSMTFYIINGYFLGYYFGSLREYPIEWLYDPRFIFGAGLFLFGFFVNVTSDNILINLRKPGETEYKIPRGGFFKYVSCPNYFGEIVEWVGFAIMTWSIPGMVYALWVGLPLFAQALSAHQWYQDRFKQEYPPERKAVIPKII